MDREEYQDAIRSFERARAHLRHYQNRMPLVVSLVGSLRGLVKRIKIAHRHLCQMSGWKFNELQITVRQRLCEALYAARRTKDSSEALLEMLNTFDEEIYMSAPITQWVSGEWLQLCRFH